ncbi:hypothetical protein [Actibacterium sp. 188UL27-1]|uniref:hypothetical protein n=1 Tax=Actibacterium sp. 188UL27-1 TaxID=2786961 RepID=UPI00195F04EC|nr:hypothetical protein [Actibacterium sp. 188UL27-1]MBM7070099.1 hypothetical protein [Actibacterium sp. 188UL27-1]
MDIKQPQAAILSATREIAFFQRIGTRIAKAVRPVYWYIIGGLCLVEVVATLLGVSPILALFLSCLVVVWSAVIAAANS